MQFNTLKEAVQFRINESEDNYWDEDFLKAEIAIATKNISDTLFFIQNDCIDEEFFWLSEIFEELAEQTQSKELISIFRTRLASVTPEKYHQNEFKSKHMRKWIDYAEYVRSVSDEIDFAEGRIKDWEE